MAWNNQWGNPMTQYGNQFNRMQNQDNNIMCVLVPSSASFDQVTIAPGQKMMVMSQTEPVFCIKVSDPMGFVTTKYCTFSEFDPNQQSQQKQSNFEQRLSRLEAIINGQSVNEHDGQTDPAVQH